MTGEVWRVERRQRLKAEVVVRFREPLARPLLGLGARSAGTARCGLGLTHMAAGAPTLTHCTHTIQYNTLVYITQLNILLASIDIKAMTS